MFLKKFFKSIRANILVGFFLTIPVVATLLIFNFLLTLATNWPLQKVFPVWMATVWKGYPLRVMTLLLVVLVFYTVGLLTRNFFGRRLYQFGDKVLTRIPLIKGIYVSVRQISESLFTQRKTLFKEVVLIQYPRKGLYSIAFVTAVVPKSVSSNMGHSNDPCVSLFIPTTPNPTSGLLILIPRSEVVPLSMPVADALTFVMSAGAVTPGEEDGGVRPTLLDKLESWLKHDNSTEGANNATTPDPLTQDEISKLT